MGQTAGLLWGCCCGGLGGAQCVSTVNKTSRSSAPLLRGAVAKDVGGEKEGSSDSRADSIALYCGVLDIKALCR